MSECCGSCLISDCNYTWGLDSIPQATILHHLITEHKIVIANIETVYDVNKYCFYWSNKITSSNLEQYLHGINVHPKDNSEPKSYFLLNDTSNEDRVLRFRLYQEKLDEILQQQQRERECTNYKIQCLFCPEYLHGDRFNISNHLYEEHSFSYGHPDNVVYTEQFIERLREKMNKFECLYCDKIFRDYKTLREHMRKKLHKKLNPSNTEFDKFYVINYREFGRTWKDLEAEKEEKETKQRYDVAIGTDDWSDWEDSNPDVDCLICDAHYTKYAELKSHMLQSHYFDIDTMTAKLSYYKQVKLVNYMRYKVDDDVCPFCGVAFPDIPNHLDTIRKLPESLLRHEVHSHQFIPDEAYADEQYLFPALDNDFLLCCLRDNNPDNYYDHPVIIPDTGVDVTDNRKMELSRSFENDSLLHDSTTADVCSCDRQ